MNERMVFRTWVWHFIDFNNKRNSLFLFYKKEISIDEHFRNIYFRKYCWQIIDEIGYMSLLFYNFCNFLVSSLRVRLCPPSIIIFWIITICIAWMDRFVFDHSWCCSDIDLNRNGSFGNKMSQHFDGLKSNLWLNWWMNADVCHLI